MGTVGVIVGRFQVDSPHSGHHALLEAVRKRHGKVLICLGCAPIRLAQEDPLDYSTRERMMRSAFPWATIVPINDRPTNEYWSECLDHMIKETFPTDTAIMYGSKKSFIPLYRGKWPVKELDGIDVASGTKLRLKIASEVRDSNDFRAGVIYACSNRYPIVYPTVDVAIWRNVSPENKKPNIELLLCEKRGVPGLCFPGGFVSPADNDMVETARREVFEETSLEVDLPIYVATCKVTDWRYTGRQDGVMTTLFAAKYLFGAAQATDDVCGVKWVPMNLLSDVVSKHHQTLATYVISYLNIHIKKIQF